MWNRVCASIHQQLEVEVREPRRVSSTSLKGQQTSKVYLIAMREQRVHRSSNRNHVVSW